MPARVLRRVFTRASLARASPHFFEKHQCPRGYYDDQPGLVVQAALQGPLRSTNAREGITTLMAPWTSTRITTISFEKHQCPRGYYDLYSEIVFVNQMIIL